MSNKPRYLCVHQGYELYGSDRMFIYSVQALREASPEAHITVHLPKRGTLAAYLEPYATEIITKDMLVLRRKIPKWESIIRFPRIIMETYKRARKFDLVYLNTMTLLSYMLVIRFIKKIRIVHIHEIAARLEKPFFNALLCWCDALLICNSKTTAQALRITRKKSHVLYNGIPISEPLKNKTVNNPVHMLLIGRMNAWKGQDIALEAMRQLRLSMDGSALSMPHLRIVGSYFENQKHHFDKLINLINQYDLREYVTIEPFTDNPEHHYKWADIVLVPSKKPEPFGLVAIEAMQHGCAVIATDHGGVAEIVRHKETGILVPANDPSSLKEAISAYINDRNMIVSHGVAGYHRLESHFTLNQYKHAFTHLIKDNDPSFPAKQA